jgi:hypothetical protein
VGFFLFLLGLFACGIFLFLLKNRYVTCVFVWLHDTDYSVL